MLFAGIDFVPRSYDGEWWKMRFVILNSPKANEACLPQAGIQS